MNDDKNRDQPLEPQKAGLQQGQQENILTEKDKVKDEKEKAEENKEPEEGYRIIESGLGINE